MSTSMKVYMYTNLRQINFTNDKVPTDLKPGK